jgi:GTP cyclohydrolase I
VPTHHIYPAGRIIGLLKISRIVDMYAWWLQGLERMIRQIADLIQEPLEPQSVTVDLEGNQLCIMM